MQGNSILRVTAGAALAISHSSNWTVDGYQIQNYGPVPGAWSGSGLLTLTNNAFIIDDSNGTDAGTFRWTGTGNLVIDVGGQFYNSSSSGLDAPFHVRTDADILGDSSRLFFNIGKVEKSAGTRITEISVDDFTVGSVGLVEPDTGTLRFTGGTVTFGSGTISTAQMHRVEFTGADVIGLYTATTDRVVINGNDIAIGVIAEFVG